MAQEYNIVNGNQIFTALNSITRDSMAKKKKRKIDFRFLDKQDVSMVLCQDLVQVKMRFSSS